MQRIKKKIKKKNIEAINDWIDHAKPIKVNYQDNTEILIDRIIKNHAFEKIKSYEKRDTSFLRRLLAGNQLETT